MLDDITQAVLAREDVARYLRGGPGQTEIEARERIHGYLDELRTTQRYPIYRALKHPLYPILRKIDSIAEHIDIAHETARQGRIIYISNHKSHLDYLIEPLSCSTNGVRPPSLPPASTCSAARSGCSTATSPGQSRSAATPRIRPTSSRSRPTSRSCCSARI